MRAREVMPAPDYIKPLAVTLAQCLVRVNGARPLIRDWPDLVDQLEYAIEQLPPGWIPGEPMP